MAPATPMYSVIAARSSVVECGLLTQHVKSAEPAPMPPPADGASQQLMIYYRGRVVGLDGCKPAKAAGLILHAAAMSKQLRAPVPALVNMSVAAKASLQRFLSKRKERYMYSRSEEAAPRPLKKGNTQASSWLSLGSLGDMHALES